MSAVATKRGTRRGDPHYRQRGPGKLTAKMREVVRVAADVAGDEIAEERVKKLKDAGTPAREARKQVQRGELGYLVYLARTEPKAFSAILARTVEKEVKVDVDTKAGPLVIFRDYSGLRLEKLPPAILRRIEKEAKAP